jgi:hypothetical protein
VLLPSVSPRAEIGSQQRVTEQQAMCHAAFRTHAVTATALSRFRRAAAASQRRSRQKTEGLARRKFFTQRGRLSIR